MTDTQTAALNFGVASKIDASLSDNVRGLKGSEILKIAAGVRELVAAGKQICNLTVGDFNPKYFPIPGPLRDGIAKALGAGETNYPPSDGLPGLRQAVSDFVERECGVKYPVDGVLIAAGARPILYGTYRCVLNPGDKVVYAVPSWNNNHYSWITQAKAVEIVTAREDGFQPTLAQIKPHLADAQLLCLCSPQNPTGTVIKPEVLREITQAVVDENRRREKAGKRNLFLLHDAVYGSLVFGDNRHANPVALVPEAAPYVIYLDGISKCFAGTGLRVGWVLAAPPVIARMRDFLGHVGAWAPRAEQKATADFLNNAQQISEFRAVMDKQVQIRLNALYDGFAAMKKDGLAVDCVHPQGAIYLSLQLKLIGKSFGGKKLETNSQIGDLLLDQAGMAVVPFQAFGLKDETGWFRLSIGAVSMADIDQALPRVRALLERVK
ncbi:MAG: aminotransferase class I/II-fold pyridoxal phosphate-dependent enzyme [Planctomycetes bacterium]|nr:aminotransferase class I/II-fold pyridoxal phosphate-dependent enzyme [Planctomycetota bacterium]